MQDPEPLRTERNFPNSTNACGVDVETAIDRAPLCVRPDTYLSDVLLWMSHGAAQQDSSHKPVAFGAAVSERVSYALVVTPNRSLLGIVTERDIVKLAAQGAHLEGVMVSEVMTKQLITLSEDDLHDCITILNLLRKHRIRHLPALNHQGQIIGVATPESLRQALQPTVLLKLRQVSEVMGTHVIEASPQLKVIQLAQMMASHHVSCIVITAPKETAPEQKSSVFKGSESKEDLSQEEASITAQQTAGYPIGIVTERDIVQFHSLGLELDKIAAQEVMSSPLVCLKPSDSLWEAHQTMQQLRVRRLVVVDTAQKLAGILTQTGFLSVLNPMEMYSTVSVLQEQVQQLQDERLEMMDKLNRSLQGQVKDSEIRFRHTFEHAAAGIVHVATNGAFLCANPQFCEIVGYSEPELLTKTWQDITHPDDLTQNEETMAALLQGKVSSLSREKRYCRKDGQVIWGRVTLSRVMHDHRSLEYLVAVIEDISSRKQIDLELEQYRNHLEELVEKRTLALRNEINQRHQVEQQLFQEKELAQVTLQSIGDAVITTDALGQVTYLNPVAEQLTGLPANLALGQPLTKIINIIDELTREPIENPVMQVLSGAQSSPLTKHALLRSRNDFEYGIDGSAEPLRDRNSSMLGAVLVFRDVTQSRQIAQQLSWQASHDALTCLANRYQFEHCLLQALDQVKSGTECVLCYLDLDQFKIVNDTCGHSAGDELLRQVSVLIAQQIRNSDMLARLGGDEFGLLLSQCSLEQATQIADQIRNAIQEFHFFWDSMSFQIGASIGLVVVDDANRNMVEVMNAADAACYTAKTRGRNRVQIYQENNTEILKQRGQQQWNLRIKKALEKDQFCLYQQRILAVNSNQNLTKSTSNFNAEILLRMVDKSGDLITPNEFIPVAERYNLMIEIDQWVVASFLSYLSGPLSPHQENRMYMINLSGASVGDDDFLDFLKSQFSVHRVKPNSICFEITETAAIANLPKAILFMQELKELGCCFALDDFGSGMSSFNYLKKLPVDYLKIDGEFIRDINSDPTAQAIVESINHIGHMMGLQTIAECVGDQAVQDSLHEIGVDFMQGFDIAKPCPLDPGCSWDASEDQQLNQEELSLSPGP